MPYGEEELVLDVSNDLYVVVEFSEFVLITPR